MNLYKEIGGFFELECSNSKSYYSTGVALNSARNALRYIIRAYGIERIAVPSYTCPVVWDAINSEKCEMVFYSIDENFMPVEQFPNDEFILYTNYFGVCGKNVDVLAERHKNLIIDNAQSFYFPPKGLASFYSPRKFFGLPDGGYALCENRLNENFETDVSYERCSHLLKRIDRGANFAYVDFKSNEASLDDEDIKIMSNLTKSLMGNIDYETAKKSRLENFAFLHKHLKSLNELNIDLSNNDAPLVYPLLVQSENLRNRLIENKIYIATYWSEIERECTEYENYLQKYLLPLPVDQRYNVSDMKRILEILCK